MKNLTATALVALAMLTGPLHAMGTAIYLPNLTYPEPQPAPADRGCLNPTAGTVCPSN